MPFVLDGNWPGLTEFSFVLAYDGGRQIFSYSDSPPYGFIKITEEVEEIVDVVGVSYSCGPYQIIYYQTKSFEQGAGNLIHKLKRIKKGGQSSAEEIFSIVDDGVYDVLWSNLAYKFNQLYVSEDHIRKDGSGMTTSKIVAASDGFVLTNGLSVGTVLHQEPLTSYSERNFFNSGNELLSYVVGSGVLLSSNDGLVFSPDLSVSGGQIKEHIIIENGAVFLLRTLDDGTEEIINYTLGTTQDYIGDEIEYLAENGEWVYFSDARDEDYQNIIMVNSATGQQEVFEMEVGKKIVGDNQAVIHDNYLTFLVYEDYMGTDLVRLNVSPNLVLGEEAGFVAYPNPIQISDQLVVESNTAGEYQITSLDGAHVQSGFVVKGSNNVYLKMVESGVYLFQFEGTTQRVVVY
ncbi:MAG: T9SS type A sorting domain-containing protein [Crocinitomicaceae bacterium]|nr:T9SS type A sorting domain-containing protein [Crocinitomicaceae bacterium]